MPVNGAEETLPNRWLGRVYKNSYTRAGRRVDLRGWSVKIQHHGRRHTFSLVGKTRRAAAIEAKAIHDSVRTEGWETTLAARPQRGREGAGIPTAAPEYWREHVVTRRYHFPASGQAEHDLAARVSHAGLGFFRPLVSAESAAAAAAAGRIYQGVVERGWERVCEEHSRELVVGFEWCSNPVIWTYTTIHTLIKAPPEPAPARLPDKSQRPRLVILEEDAGIRRSLSGA